jgi:SIR2-like domain
MSNIPPVPPTNDLLFEVLTRVIWEGRCIVVIGAGVSAADYPLWPDLIAILQERCGLRAEDLLSTHPLDVAQAAKDKNPQEYARALDDVFRRKERPLSAKRYHLLARTKFASYINLNVDPLLLDILDLHFDIRVSEYPHLQNQHHGPQELFYVHGRLGPDRPAATSQIVLTRSEFDRAYDPLQTRLYGFIQATMLDHHVCFIGCNPTEPYLARMLAACKGFCDADHGLVDLKRPRWFLLAEDSYPELPSLAASAIHLVRYPRRDASFSGMDAVLDYWAKKKPPVFRTPGVEPSPYRVDVEPDR